jgi:hypothetical protein
MQLVFNEDFSFKVSDNLKDFAVNNFNVNNENSIIIYSFNEASIEPGKIKLLTKLEDSPIVLDEKKSATSTLKGLTLNVEFKPNIFDHQESIILGPNPSNGQMNIFYSLPIEIDEIRLKVFNLNGSEVWSSKKIKNISGEQKTSIDISFLSKGLCFMRIEKYNKENLLRNDVKRLIIK